MHGCLDWRLFLPFNKTFLVWTVRFSAQKYIFCLEIVSSDQLKSTENVDLDTFFFKSKTEICQISKIPKRAMRIFKFIFLFCSYKLLNAQKLNRKFCINLAEDIIVRHKIKCPEWIGDLVWPWSERRPNTFSRYFEGLLSFRIHLVKRNNKKFLSFVYESLKWVSSIHCYTKMY